MRNSSGSDRHGEFMIQSKGETMHENVSDESGKEMAAIEMFGQVVTDVD